MKTLPLLIIGCTCATVLSHPNTNTANEDVDVSIIDGDNAKRRQFPYMVSIQIDRKHHCGASIISSRWLASAAHCFYHYSAEFEAVAGLLEQGEHHPDIQTIPVRRILIHPDYNKKYGYNDIALLKLKYPLTFTKAVGPVKLPQPNAQYNGSVVVSGWGFISKDPNKLPAVLQYAVMKLISNEECNKILAAGPPSPTNYPLLVRSEKVCALPSELGQYICHHDSGGPLVQDNVLMGIVHGGDAKCATELDTIYPSIFARVAQFTSFVKQYVQDL